MKIHILIKKNNLGYLYGENAEKQQNVLGFFLNFGRGGRRIFDIALSNKGKVNILEMYNLVFYFDNQYIFISDKHNNCSVHKSNIMKIY